MTRSANGAVGNVLPQARRSRRPTWLLLLLCAFWNMSGSVGAEGGGNEILDAAYRQLDVVRREKREQLTQYLDRVRSLADAVRDDETMRRYFLVKKQYFELQRHAPPPPDLAEAVEVLKHSIRQHYLSHYLAFYDVLFVSRDGYVFSSIRRQRDYHRNLFQSELQATSLARQLKSDPERVFVDFEYYAISDEPSAFFVEPMIEDGTHEGWFVLQCAINKINSIFARGEGLGQTGEVFLVNERQQMLTESRFRPDSSILQMHLSKENIDAKFAEGQGHRIVRDYRGYRAITSFRVYSMLGSRWLLIAKIDEDEVLTRHYRQHRQALGGALLHALQKTPEGLREPRPLPADVRIVDMDEFRIGRGTDTLVTFGVSTCTAIVASLPGTFVYLGHASTHDVIYPEGTTDLFGHMLKRIRQFEICPYQQRAMEVLLVAPHSDSLLAAVDKLLDEGFLLSQIRFACHPQAQSATVVSSADAGRTRIEWRLDDRGQAAAVQEAQDMLPLSETLKAVIGYE